MKRLYLLSAIAGGVLPYVFFIRYFATEGLSLGGFVRALFVNAAAGGFATDLVLTSAIFWIFMFHQKSREKGPSPIPFIVLNLLVGLSCAFPAYLYSRERAVTAA